MAVLLSLAAALAYGLSDFVGGLASRRTSAWPVAFVGAVAAFAGAVVLALVTHGSPSSADLWWGALAGIGSGAGGAFLYRGLAAGRMGVVAPISAVGAAAGYIKQLTPRWGIYSYARYDRLVGDAAASPIVRRFGSRDQISGGLALTYTFGRGL